LGEPLRYPGLGKTEEGMRTRIEEQETRLKRLARSIDALADRDRSLLERAREMAALRRRAAAELHSICAEFVMSLNRLLSRESMLLDPPDFNEGAFHEEGRNVIQINVRGRILQIEFGGTEGLVSTEEFRIPYTMDGAVRAYNQELLDKDIIEEQLLYYTLEKDRKWWRFFDPRTYRSGPFDQEYLVSLMEQLI
jgi:hypothetical protein